MTLLNPVQEPAELGGVDIFLRSDPANEGNMCGVEVNRGGRRETSHLPRDRCAFADLRRCDRPHSLAVVRRRHSVVSAEGACEGLVRTESEIEGDGGDAGPFGEEAEGSPFQP